MKWAKMSTSTEPPAQRSLPHGCGRCPARWGGKRQAHCATCHTTFSGIRAFDLHRRAKACYVPSIQPERAGTVCRGLKRAGLALVERAGYAVWALSENDERWDREKEEDDD